jgi:hypothetical protein
MDWLKLKALAVLRWVRDAVVAVWNMHVDPPAKLFKFYFFACFALFLAGGVSAIWLFGPTSSATMKIPAADKFVSARPAAPLAVEPSLPAIFPKQLNPGPLPVAATPLPCVPTPAVKVLNPAKQVPPKPKRRKPKAAPANYWSF